MNTNRDGLKKKTMKLRQRVLITVSGIIFIGFFYIAIHPVPVSVGIDSEKILPNIQSRDDSPKDSSQVQWVHMSPLRKRLNKSNYTSDDIGTDGDRDRNKKDLLRTENSENFLNESAPETGSKQSAKNIGILSNSTGNSGVMGEDAIVEEFIQMLTKLNNEKFNFAYLRKHGYNSVLKSHRKRNRRKGFGLPVYRNYGGARLTSWEKFHKGIQQYALYDPDDPAIHQLLHDIAKQPIVDVEMKDGGTQLKLIFTFLDEGQALFKPMRYPREQETLPDHFYFVDFERHYAEIASFHLDRILGFYRVPPTVGRLINITKDIHRFADNKLAKTIFRSPANNLCFHGTCSYYCDTSHAVCGSPDVLEGSFAAFIPPERIASRKTWRNPWKRSYSKHRKAYWEIYGDLCDKIRERPPYDSGRRLLDVMDTHIFDFLTGNMDRHHYETFSDFGNETFPIHMDQGRAFGKSKTDEMSIILPLYQCCLIRYSTFTKIVHFYLGPNRLSELMRTSLAKDPLNPILTEAHLEALDRRVIKILQTLYECIQGHRTHAEVIVDDYF